LDGAVEVRDVSTEGIIVHRGELVLEADFGPGDTGQLAQAALEACRAQEAVHAVDAPLPTHDALYRLRVRGQNPALFPGGNRPPPASPTDDKKERSKRNYERSAAITRQLRSGVCLMWHLFHFEDSWEIRVATW
jgi:hypothetical protein